LIKIYTDAPQEWFSDVCDIKVSLQQLFDHGIWLISSRFNAHLLGALKAEKDGDTIYLSHFCVRKVIVKRDVAHQMMHHINNWADECGYTLVAKDTPAELANALKNIEFVEEDNNFLHNPKWL
jgi:hypothetical protein